MLDKRTWVMKHWMQTGNGRVGDMQIIQPIGEMPHKPIFKEHGFVWTPKLCMCPRACLLDTSEKVKKDKRRYL